MERPKDGVPFLDPESDMKITHESFKKLTRRITALEGMLSAHALRDDPDLTEKVASHAKRRDLSLRHKIAKKEAKAAAGLCFRDELKQRLRVLKRLGHVDDDGVVLTKGRVACEMTTADALVTTELVFDGAFKELPAELCCAAISALVWREAGPDIQEIKLSPACKDAHARIREVARAVGRHVAECKLEMDVAAYADSFRPDLMDLTRAWSTGTSFVDLMKMTSLHEGSVVRAIRRMEEVMRQLATACQNVGDAELREKFESCREMVKRDIVFCPSLFL
jgi:ATP-dependent RNA helicase DOB1|tara:strand:- start:125 stop:961 length:837 start_codon:yes stop_codon:yes gene_type:complete